MESNTQVLQIIASSHHASPQRRTNWSRAGSNICESFAPGLRPVPKTSGQPRYSAKWDRLLASATPFTSSTISIVADISRAKDTVQEPQSHPIRSMLAGRRALIKQRPRHGSRLRLLPSIDDGLAAAILSNMMPKEGRCYGRVVLLVVCQAFSISVQSIVYNNGFLLSMISV